MSTAVEFDLAKYTRDMEVGMALEGEWKLLTFFEAFTPSLVKYCRSLELRLGINPPLPPGGTPIQEWLQSPTPPEEVK